METPIRQLKAAASLLNLGCGNRYHTAWTNVDIRSRVPEIMAHDLTRELPFEKESFHGVYSSHIIEHLPRSCIPMFLQECYRVLIPGGGYPRSHARL